MHQALYRKWRPQAFDEVYGQEHITSILKYEIQNSKFSHAYLFCGSRGTGKTTCAKILSKAINCESPINGNPCNRCEACRAIDAGIATDVLEMDAASNNGVDNIRDIREEVVYMPSVLKYRVYIVDEVHMLSQSAFNALLKTLEEPPSHVVFILATTELHKLPSTIVSRCQRYDFRRITTDVIVERLSLIADSEQIEYDLPALRIIAKIAQGGMRDAISLLELCAGTRQRLSVKLVNDTLGAGGNENLEATVRAIAKSDFETVFSTLSEILSSSKDVAVFWQDLIAFYRDILVVKTTSIAKKYLDITDDEYEKLKDIASLFNKETLLYHCRVLDDAFAVMQKATTAKRTVAEMAIVKMCDPMLDDRVDSLFSRVAKLESAVETVSFNSSFNSNPIVDNAFIADNTDTVPVSEVKRVETAKAQISVEPQASAQVELKALRGWCEVSEKISAENPFVGGILKIAKAFVGSDGTVYIRFQNQFASNSVSEDARVMKTLRASLSTLLKRPIAENQISFGLFEGNEDLIEELDELNL